MGRKRKLDLTAMARRIEANRQAALHLKIKSSCPQYINGKAPLWVPRTRVIVCGTRTFDDYNYFKKKMDRFTFWFDVVEIVIGSHGQRVERNFEYINIGADAYGKQWAEYYWYKHYTFWADWSLHGKAAGPIRNKEMAQFAAEQDTSHCIAFWDGQSKGTLNMINEFVKYNSKERLKVCRYD